MTDFNTKVDILCDLIVSTMNVPAWDNFKRANDLGISLAVAEQSDLATLNDKGKGYVEQTYQMLLDVLNLDGEYADIGELFDDAIAKGAKTSDQ